VVDEIVPGVWPSLSHAARGWLSGRDLRGKVKMMGFQEMKKNRRQFELKGFLQVLRFSNSREEKRNTVSSNERGEYTLQHEVEAISLCRKHTIYSLSWRRNSIGFSHEVQRMGGLFMCCVVNNAMVLASFASQMIWRILSTPLKLEDTLLQSASPASKCNMLGVTENVIGHISIAHFLLRGLPNWRITCESRDYALNQARDIKCSGKKGN
jgi:hypothetical protein